MQGVDPCIVEGLQCSLGLDLRRIDIYDHRRKATGRLNPIATAFGRADLLANVLIVKEYQLIRLRSQG